MNGCPCCSNRLLRHWKHNTISWHCLNCRQEMPNFNVLSKAKQIRSFYSRVPLSLVNCYQQIPQEILEKLSFYQQLTLK
jgi:hypothetical protein